jgi:hypothetical protein
MRLSSWTNLRRDDSEHYVQVGIMIILAENLQHFFA